MILIIGLVSCTPAGQVPKPTGKDLAPPAVPITVIVVSQGQISATLVYSGNVQARQQVNVVPKITGRIERLYVDTGDDARQGELIAELDSAALEAQVHQAEAAVEVSQARLAQVTAGSKQEDIDAAAAAVRAAEARVDQARSGARAEEIAGARAQVAQAQSRLDSLIAGPKSEELAGLDAAVDQARAQQDQIRAQLASANAVMVEAKARFEQAKAGLGGPNTRAEDIAANQAALNAARSRLDELKAGPRPEDVRATELAVARARTNLKAAEDAIENCGQSPTTTRSQVRNQNTGQTTTTTTRQRVSCAENERDNRDSLRDIARIALREAENLHERTKNGATPFQISQAEDAVRQADAQLQRTRFGGTTDVATLELRYGQSQADVERLQAQLEQSQASLDAAQSRVDAARNPSEFDLRNAQEVVGQAQANLARLVNPNPFEVRSAQAALEQAQAALASRQRPTSEDIQIAEAQLEQSVAALEAAEVNLAETNVRAPFTGIVAQRFVSVGATVGTSTPIVNMVSKETEVILQVEEARVGQVQRGQPALITVAAYPGDPVPGAVASIAPTADPRSRTFAVRVYPNDPEGKLREGMFAQVALQTAGKQATLVPVQSVVNRSGRNLVFVVGPDNRVQAREVTLGINDGRNVEIIQGLNPGEDVAISALDVLSDGTPVVVTRQG